MSSGSGESKPAPFATIEREIAALGDDTTRMGGAFERVVLHYLRRDPTVGFTDAWLWDDWPDRIRLGLKSDQGVDIVATDGEGKRVAVQVKFHSDPDRAVTQREVSTLFSFRPDLFDRWVVVTNAIGHGPNAERATAGRGDFTWVHRDDLADSTIDWSGALEAVSGKAEPQIKRRSPREPDQVEAIGDTVAALEDHERVQLIMACGTGKTLTTRWITEARKDRLVLVLVPTLLLLKQFRNQWREQANYGFIDIGVCSDADTMESSRDVWQVHPDELGVRVTTDPTDIATFLKGDGRRVVFGTYASSVRIAEAQADPAVPAFDLVVADEAHRVAGITSRGNRTERDTKVVLDGNRIRAKRRLFATATPRVYGRNIRVQLDNREDVEFASMDDVDHFGVEAHRLWFKRAVELGRLVDYRLSVVVVSDAEVDELIRERAFLDVQGRRFDAETLAALIAVRRAVDELGVRRVITFHHTIKRAEDFASELERLELDAPAVSAHHVSGSMSMADRQRVLASLEEPAQPTVVTNARCLTEGIDVPALGAVAFVDPRSAPVDIVQAVGRVMRISEGKELGHVIVPVYLTEKQLADPESAVESSAFEPVLAVLRALRAHDPELVTDATRIATSLGRRDAVVAGYINDHFQVLGTEINVRDFEQALELRFVDVAQERWKVGYAHLRAFSDETGHARPVKTFIADDGYRLGQWVGQQRTFYMRGTLSPSRIAAIEELPGWTWNTREADWQEGMDHLRAFVTEAGHGRPQASYVAQDGYRLGSWVNAQRSSWKRGELELERIADLEGISGWTWDQLADAWEEGVAHLQTFVTHAGHAIPSSDYVTDDGYPLGRWVVRQRAFYRRGKLARDRIAALEALPAWTWHTKDANWQKALAHLWQYAETAGHAMPPEGYVAEDGFRLGKWVAHRRSFYAKGKLAPERIADLEALPGWAWDPFDASWQEGLTHLRVFVDETGHARVPQGHVAADGYRLGTWVNARRQDRRKGKLVPDRESELESLPGWSWNPHEDAWRVGLDQLKAYAADTGVARPSRSYVTDEGFRLGEWVKGRRTQYARGRLPSDRVAELEALPGWVWKVR